VATVDRATLRSATTFCGNTAANAVAFARQLVEVGFDREDAIVRIAQNIAKDIMDLESLIAAELSDTEHEDTGPLTSPEGESQAQIEVVN
jgi:hypothetical protein